MIFNSAGHNTKGPRVDPGAIANGYREADLTAEFRNLVNGHLKAIGASFKTDTDEESLAEYLGRIKTGSGSVIHETHFNAGVPTATGIEVIVPEKPSDAEVKCARELAAEVHRLTNLPLRGEMGVKTEFETHRGRLGIMRPEGINVLTEICFISNRQDLDAYFAVKDALAASFAKILKKYDDMFV